MKKFLILYECIVRGQITKRGQQVFDAPCLNENSIFEIMTSLKKEWNCDTILVLNALEMEASKTVAPTSLEDNYRYVTVKVVPDEVKNPT